VCAVLCGLPVFAQASGPGRPSIQVIVTDSQERPIPGAEIAWADAATPPRRGPQRPVLTEMLQTGADGKGWIDLPAEGPYRVMVRCAGYLDASDITQLEHTEVVQADAVRTVKLFVELVRSASFHGAVYLESGRRVPGALVRLQAAVESWAGTLRGAAPRWLAAKTDAQGNFDFPMAPPGQYGMWIAPPEGVVKESLSRNDRGEWTGYGAAIWHTSVEELRRIIPVDIEPGEDVRGYNVVLRKTRVYFFKGTLREWTGEPVTRAKVAVQAAVDTQVNLLEPRPVNTLTGDFDFPALPEGHYSLLVFRDDAADGVPYAIPLELGGAGVQGDSRHAIRIPPWALVAGRVVLRRPGLASAAAPEPPFARRVSTARPAPVQVSLAPVSFGRFAGAATAKLESVATNDPNTLAFPVTPIPPGEYEFRVQAPEPWYAASARWDGLDLLKEGILPLGAQQYAKPLEFVVELRPGGSALDGTIVDENGAPVVNGTMCAAADELIRRRQPGGAFCVRSDTDGTFRSRWLSPGAWLIWAFTKKPHEEPGGAAFEDNYERRAQKLMVPENGALGRVSIRAIE